MKIVVMFATSHFVSMKPGAQPINRLWMQFPLKKPEFNEK